MTREEIVEAIANNKMIPYINPDFLPGIVDFVLDNYSPSLPSNLDEAAEEYAYKTTWDHGVRFDSFKAGVEWMSGQGYTFETIMQEDDVDELVPTCPDMYNHGYSCGDKVIVQIKKKQ